MKTIFDAITKFETHFHGEITFVAMSFELAKKALPELLPLITVITYVMQGATIKAEEGTGRILIARVMHGGAADRSGLISVGDEVIEVNGVNVEGTTPNDVLRILVSLFI